ncbi:MAG TPA: uroporphyrinogen decarboxylase [Acidobacteriaceae bacterium]|nr:uroporphyrinogen decarboxylase [Acidobacteriaceae bacterium]
MSEHDLTSGTGSSRFIRACLRQPVDRTPVWFLRQAGRYMPEYMAVRKHHSLLEICRTPDIAAEVTITAAERLGVDAAIIFADLLLPFTPMGLDFEFINGEGPVVHRPVRSLEHIQALRTDRTDDLRYVSQAIEKVARHFAAPRPDGDTLGIIGFCGAPFTLASYMIEGGSSRNYIETKKIMYASAPSAERRGPSAETSGLAGSSTPINQNDTASPKGPGLEGGLSPLHEQDPEPGFSPGPARSSNPLNHDVPPSTEDSGLAGGFSPPNIDATERGFSPGPAAAWPLLMSKLIDVLAAYAAQQVEAGADVIQVFDSWAGALSVSDFRDFCLAPTTELIRRIRALGVPVIYFGVDTASLLPSMRETGADVLGLDWRIPLADGRRILGPGVAVQGNLDPITLFAPDAVLETRVREILAENAARPGHIFNLGHGIVPGTPVDNVLRVVDLVKQYGTSPTPQTRDESTDHRTIRA